MERTMEGALELQAAKISAATQTPKAARPTPADIDSALARFGKIARARLRGHDLRRHGIDSDDVEQNVRIRLWAALEREAVCDFSTAYIQKVVLSVVIDAIRRERIRRSEFGQNLDAVEATHADHGRQPDLLLAQNQWMDRLRQCIGSLPFRRQRPVRLYLMGYTMQELSDPSGLSLDAGSKLVRRGLAELRCLIREQERSA
jgi:RNA polymerase sigma factor (sigma-70 family)